jgi:uncharacterized protein DUF3313
MTPFKTLLSTFALGGALLLQGCATTPAPPSTSTSTSTETRRDLASAIDSSYHAVFIESFRLDPAALPTGESPEALATATQALLQAFRDGLAERGALAAQPGPGVVTVAIVVNELNTSSPTVNVISSLVAGLPLDTGGAALRAEFFDSETHRLLGTNDVRRKATPFKIKGSFSRYGHAESILREWGRELAGRAGPCSQSGPKACASSAS